VPFGAEITQNYCKDCDRYFSTKGVLNRHLIRKHGIDNRSKIVKNLKKAKSSVPKSGITDKVRPPNSTVIPPNSTKMRKRKSTTCEYCENTFSRSDALKRHYPRCDIRNDKLKRLEEVEKENEELKEVNKDVIKTNKYAMSAFNYLAKTFKETPALNRVRVDQLDTIMYKDHNTDDDFKLVESLIYYHRFKRLHEYIGDTIVALYRKHDPETQSIWNSDTQRLSYIIRTLVDDDIEWKRDNGGKKVLKVVINPILEYIEKKIKGYILELPEDKYHPKKFNEMILDAHKLSRELKDIKDLGRSILGYITPFFHFNNNNLIEFE